MRTKLILSFLLAGAVLSASPITASINVVNPGQPVEKDSNGHDVGPYTLNVNGTNVQALCVDDTDWAPTSWTANVTNLGSGNLSATYHPGDLQEYEEDAWIFTQITQSGANRVALQDAAWDIIDDSITNVSQIPNVLLGTAVGTDIANAISDYGSVDMSDFEILSGTDPSAQGRPQEFIVAATPEPASFALLGAGLLLAGAFRSRLRKQSACANA